MAVPKCVAQHDKGRAVGAMLIRGVKKMSAIGLNAQDVKVVPAGLMHPDAEWFLAYVQARKADLISCQINKAVVAIAQVEIVRIRFEANPAAINSPERLLLRQIQGAQEQRVQYTKNDGVGADGQRQRRNRGDREPGRLTQKPKAEARILKKSCKKPGADGLVNLFFVSLAAAELDARQTFCFGAIHAGTLKVICAVLDVRAKF